MSTAAIDIELRLPFAGERTVRVHSESGRVAVVGPSGVGKTSLVRAIAGVGTRAHGRVHIRGEAWQDDARDLFVPPWLRRVAWVPQDARLFPHVSVRNNVVWGASPTAAEITEVCAALELDGLMDRAPRNLSGGERQRVALARALLRPASVLLLDEPFGALDRALRARVIEAVAARVRTLPVVLISHDDRDLASLAEDVVSLDG